MYVDNLHYKSNIILSYYYTFFYSENHTVLTESFEDNEKTFVANEDIIETNECRTLNEELLGEDNYLVPKVGMKFNDENEVFEFYKMYAYHVGFLV